jgi:hypothetical protein
MKGAGFRGCGKVVEAVPFVQRLFPQPLKPLRVHRLAGLNICGELKMDVIVETPNKVGFD